MYLSSILVSDSRDRRKLYLINSLEVKAERRRRIDSLLRTRSSQIARCHDKLSTCQHMVICAMTIHGCDVQKGQN